MSKERSRFPWFGIALIILGGVLLMKRFFDLTVAFWQVFWGLLVLLGFVGVARGFSGNNRWKVFWSSVLFFYGLFFFLHTIDAIYINGNLFFPASFLIFGFSFIMAYILDLRDWYLLIPGLTLTLCGAAFLMTQFGYFDSWELWDIIRRYWPVLLILFGAGMILRRRPQEPPEEITM